MVEYDPFSEEIISGTFKEGSKVKVAKKDGVLTFNKS